MLKNIPLIALACLTLLVATPALTRADDTDRVRFLVAKGGDDIAKVTIGSQEYLVPIEFETMQNLGWKDVKDGYALPPAYISLLKQGRIKISITCSGTSFIVVRPNQKR